MIHFILCGALGLIFSVSSALAIDYDRIDRTILKEPTYRTGSPKYVLLLFGPQAKRVWMVIDGETVYIDRNSDGDLTEAKERFDDYKHNDFDVEIADPDGVTKYIIRNLTIIEAKASPTGRTALVNVRVNGPVTFRQYCDVATWETPGKAAIAHFNGLLTIGPDTDAWKLASWEKLRTGDQPAELAARVGTMDEKHGCWVVVSSMIGQEPMFRGYTPMGDIEFPAQKPGDPPVRQRYILDDVCCGCDFKGSVKAPAEAGPGMAKVTFSFNMWKEGHVASSTAEIPVISAEQAKKEADEAAAKSAADNTKAELDQK